MVSSPIVGTDWSRMHWQQRELLEPRDPLALLPVPVVPERVGHAAPDRARARAEARSDARDGPDVVVERAGCDRAELAARPLGGTLDGILDPTARQRDACHDRVAPTGAHHPGHHSYYY
jgi:hypothetical protein